MNGGLEVVGVHDHLPWSFSRVLRLGFGFGYAVPVKVEVGVGVSADVIWVAEGRWKGVCVMVRVGTSGGPAVRC